MPRLRCAQRRPIRAAAIMVMVLLGVACSNDDNAPSAKSTTTAPSTSGTSTTQPSTTDSSTSTSSTSSAILDERVEFLLGLLNDPAVVDAAAIGEQFTPDFLAQVPADAIIGAVREATGGAKAPWTVVERKLESLGGQLIVQSSDGTRLALELALEPNAPNRIASATIQPDLDDLFVHPGTPAEVDAALRAAAAKVHYAIYDAAGGTCRALRELDGREAVATGSAFKLWVLDALARMIDDGRARWDETMVVEDRHRSSPDGEVYPLKNGTTVTLRKLAELMISISDNTATDHLMARVGRQPIERLLIDLKISTAARNAPFLTTAELFKLKFVQPELGDRYVKLTDENQRRTFLDGEVAKVALPWIADPTAVSRLGTDEPRHIDDLEWFATPLDLCQTFNDLDRLASKPGLEPIAEILSINPGVPFPSGTWSDVRFKGGSEPGVFTLAHWLRAADGTTRVAVIGLSDPKQDINASAAASAATRLLALVRNLG